MPYPNPLRPGDSIPVARVWGPGSVTTATAIDNLINGRGMTGRGSRRDLHDNARDGASMWLTRADDVQIIFDFGATYPVREIWLWNYNQGGIVSDGLARRGLRSVIIETSLDGHDWIRNAKTAFELAPATGQDGLSATNLNDGQHSPIWLPNPLARFVRLVVAGGPGVGNWGGIDGQEPLYGLSAVRFYAGEGWVAEPDRDWDAQFWRMEGWTGADGIYSVPLEGQRTLYIFGDTFVGRVDPASDKRLDMTMINNSIAIGHHPDPRRASLDFQWKETNEPQSVFVPKTPYGRSVAQSYYWLQAGANINGAFYCLPMIVAPDPDGPEGFQFAVHGVTMTKVPMSDGALDWEAEMQWDVPLYAEDGRGSTQFGAAILNNTGPRGDGWVYVYGLRGVPAKDLLVARTRPEDFESVAAWRFWDGTEWSPRLLDAAAIAHGVSSELSVSPNIFDPGGGWLLVYGHGSLEHQTVAVATAAEPFGPFSPPTLLYFCPEPDTGDGIYAYNPKAHPALSSDEMLLVSYNVNARMWDTHVWHASVYRPRFIHLRQLTARARGAEHPA